MQPKIFQNYRRESFESFNLKNRRETQTDWSWISDMKMLDKLKEGKVSLAILMISFEHGFIH